MKYFHCRVTRVRKYGQYELKYIANVDQLALPFILDDGKTYTHTGGKVVWCRIGPSGQDKRQCSVLTIFADGKPRARPLLIFRGKGLRISKAERD